MSAPAYYPPGWDKQRWQSATEEEFAVLTDDQFETFHTGLPLDVGDDGAEEFFEEMDRKQAALKNATAPPPAPSERPPKFILTLADAREADSGFPEWGFAVFRTAGYDDDDDDDVVTDVKRRIEAHIDEQFDAAGTSNDVQDARENFRLMWFESGDLNGAKPEQIARRFEAANVPIWLRHSLCLCVDEWSVKSIQNEASGKAPAHILAMSSTCGEELTSDEADNGNWTVSFKVAVKSLVELFAEIGNGSLTPYEIGAAITPDLVRTDGSRFGMKKTYADGEVSSLKWEGRLRK